MIGTIGMTLLGMVLLQATEAPDISGQWASDEWGTVVLEAKQPGQYEGSFTGSGKDNPAPIHTPPGFGIGGVSPDAMSPAPLGFDFPAGVSPKTELGIGGAQSPAASGFGSAGVSPKTELGIGGAQSPATSGFDFPGGVSPKTEFSVLNGSEKTKSGAGVLDKTQSGTLRLKWSRVERRFNGTWGTGGDRSGKMSLRLVDKEIRGGWTTNEGAQLESGTPRLGDLLWKRSKQTNQETAQSNFTQAERAAALAQRAIAQERSQAAGYGPEPRIEHADVNLEKDGTLFLNGKKVTLDELKALASKDAKKKFTIRADKDVPYAKVIEVLDALKAAGVTELSFRVVAPDAPAPTPRIEHADVNLEKDGTLFLNGKKVTLDEKVDDQRFELPKP